MTLATFESQAQQLRSQFYSSTQPWVPAEIEMMKRLAAQGLSAGQIAERMPGRTRNAIIGKVHRILGKGHLQRPTVDPERRNMLLVLRKERHKLRAREYRLRQREWRPKVSTMVDVTIPKADPSIGVPLSEMADDHCRFIAGNARAPAPYCGRPAIHSNICYCAFHFVRMYQPERRRQLERKFF